MALLSAVPEPDPRPKKQRIVLKGEVPSPSNPPTGCPFHPRCPLTRAGRRGGRREATRSQITVGGEPIRVLRKCVERDAAAGAEAGRAGPRRGVLGDEVISRRDRGLRRNRFDARIALEVLRVRGQNPLDAK